MKHEFKITEGDVTYEKGKVLLSSAQDYVNHVRDKTGKASSVVGVVADEGSGLVLIVLPPFVAAVTNKISEALEDKSQTILLE